MYKLGCDGCKSTMGAVGGILQTRVVMDTIEGFAEQICHSVVKKNITVCPGAVRIMGDVILPALTRLVLSPDYMCNKIVGICKDTTYEVIDYSEYVHRILKDKPDFLNDNDYINKLYKVVMADRGNRRTFKAVHMSDLHVDLDYTPGTNANCNTPLCCRKENGIPADPKDAAGYWGAYNCDTTHAAISKMFDFIRDEI